MDPEDDGLWCDGCGVEMTWAPILTRGQRYCCALCADGGACECGYPVEDQEEEGGPALVER